MLRKTKELKGARLAALDGLIGHLKDFYFDDQTWTLRYLVADTGNWLPNRRVLLSPFAVTRLETDPHKVFAVNLTKKQIEESPSIEAHKPVSRQHEAQFAQYYGWPNYWPGPLLWGPVEAPWAYLPPAIQAGPPLPPLSAHGQDSHLRSVDEISGFSGHQIQALDQVVGHVETFVFDDRTWAIRYLVCDTRLWWPGKHFLLAPPWIAWVSWTEARVYVDLDREAIRRAPEYDPKMEITREYEEKLYTHYNREPYWRPEGALAAVSAR